MEAIAESIIEQWKKESGTKSTIPLSSIKVKHQDHIAGVYTLYISGGSTGLVTTKLKAIKDNLAWKIIEMK